MPITMGGMASGVNTDAVIEKLVKLEARPIYELEESKKTANRKKEGLQVLKRNLTDLDSKARDLYGFRASYEDKKTIISEQGVFEAKAAKLAPLGNYKVQVNQIASTHKITTDQYEEAKEIGAGTFKIEVNGESHQIKFGGGKLKKLQEKIDENASAIVSTSFIKTAEEKNILTIESKVAGKKGEIKLTGDEEFLKSVGLIKGYKDDLKNEINVVFDTRFFSTYVGEKKVENQNGNIDIGRDGKSFTIKGLLWQEYEMPVEVKLEKNSVMEFDISIIKDKKKDDDDKNIPFKVELGPDEKVNIKGIELRGYNPSRLRPVQKVEKKEYDSFTGVGIVVFDKGKRIEKVFPLAKDAKGKIELPVGAELEGKSVNRIIFYANDGSAEYQNAKFLTPVKSKGLLEAKNVVEKPEDAKLKVDGIEITRDKNNDINDVIKGVTLDLKSASKEIVELKIAPDSEKAIERIKKFVEAYNKYIDLNKELLKSEKTDKPGEQKNKHNTGLFMGDMTVIRLENSVRRVVNGAYSSNADSPVKTFSQIGVSTGRINSDWENIKDGKLIIDDAVLEKSIRENPEGVKSFFGSDTDGDSKIDNGMAYKLVESLKPYISTGKNIITSKIDFENESIKLADEKIAKKNDHIKQYEEKLRKKFAGMERAISNSKNQQNSFKNQGYSGQEMQMNRK